MNPISNISSKTQVTIPQAMRARMSVHPGDKIEFAYEDGKIVLKIYRPQRRSFAKWAGAFSAFDTPSEHDA